MGQRFVLPMTTRKTLVTLRRLHSVSVSVSSNFARRNEYLQNLSWAWSYQVIRSRYYPLVMASALSLVGSMKHEK